MTTDVTATELPPMHQISPAGMLTEAECQEATPLRRPCKMSDGGGLCLLVAPCGGRCWQYNYRYSGKQKTIALGIYPDVPLVLARECHQGARSLLAQSIDPSQQRYALRRQPIT